MGRFRTQGTGVAFSVGPRSVVVLVFSSAQPRREFGPVGRSLLIILTVAAIAGWLNRAEQAVGVPHPGVAQEVRDAGRWVRTVDGWETRTALAIRPAPPMEIHPGLVAGAMATISLLALVAFPGNVAPVRQIATAGLTIEAPAARTSSLSRKRRRRIAAAAR